MAGDLLVMSKTERLKKAILASVKEGHFNLREAAERLELSKRQVRRLLRRYEQDGDQGLVHKHRGGPSNHVLSAQTKAQILEKYISKYKGFGPTFAAEKLTEDEQLPIQAETLRLWLKQAGLWEKARKRSAYRQRRPRREHFGDLLQLDGSFHAWFGAEEPTACLMDLVDDATGITLALMDKEETTVAAMKLLQQWIERYGVPKAIYVDLKSVYVSPKENKGTATVDGSSPGFTHFSRACAKLGIKIIKAYSPQAKGRVERKHAVFQDRFVKELSLKGFKTIEQANELLASRFLKSINDKYAKLAASPEDGHCKADLFGDLSQIFCWDYSRQLQNDWTISFRKHCYQIQKNATLKLQAKQSILVRQHLDGTLSLWKDEHRLVYEEIAYSKPPAKIKKGPDLQARSQLSRANRHNTPWSQFNPSWLSSKKAHKQAAELV